MPIILIVLTIIIAYGVYKGLKESKEKEKAKQAEKELRSEYGIKKKNIHDFTHISGLPLAEKVPIKLMDGKEYYVFRKDNLVVTIHKSKIISMDETSGKKLQNQVKGAALGAFVFGSISGAALGALISPKNHYFIITYTGDNGEANTIILECYLGLGLNIANRFKKEYCNSQNVIELTAKPLQKTDLTDGQKSHTTENAELKAKILDLEKMLSTEQTTDIDLSESIRKKQEKVDELSKSIESKQCELSKLKEKLIELPEEIQLQEFGLYRPKYDFVNSTVFADKLKEIRQKQKDLIKSKAAVTGSTTWTVNGSVSEGKKMVSDMQKLLLRAFNSECDELIEKVKFNTLEVAEKRIKSSFETISKLGAIMSVSITYPYYQAKLEELYLAFEYRQKKQAEKEEQKEIKARMREEAKLQREIEEARKSVYKEKSHYEGALKKINQQLEQASEIEMEALEAKKKEIEEHIEAMEESLKNIDYREANARAGYVYVISNIGSFGENVYKIGMTRRLEPMDRIDELGDASVPFDFDVHAMIFSDDAPALETALHKAFENKKVNMVNRRREFFNVTLEEIEAVVKRNYDKTVEFIKLPEAQQYRESIKMRNYK